MLLRVWSAFVGVVFGVIESVGKILAWLRQRRSVKSGQAAESRAEPAQQPAAVERSTAAAKKPARALRKAAANAVADDTTTANKLRARRATKKKTANKPEDPGER